MDLKKPFFASFLIHIFVFSFFIFSPKFHFFKKIETKVVWIEIPKGASEEIDLKIKESLGLPKTTIKEQKEALKKEMDEKAKPEKKEMVVKQKPKQALRPIQPEPRPKHLKLQKEKKDWEKALDKLAKAKPAPPEAAQVKDKGEGFKYGTGLEPVRVPINDPEYVAYQAKVRYKILDEWILPLTYLEGTNPPKARLVIFINKEGLIVEQEWEVQSGNPAFDSSCKRAIVRASPLPIPPPRLEWEAYNEGFLVEFDPTLAENAQTH